MKKLFSFILNSLLLLLYPLGYLVPRSKKRAILAAGNNAFAGNPKHLFFYLENEEEEFSATWLTKDEKVYKLLKKKGLSVEMYYSVGGLFACLRAKYWFYNMSFSELNFYASAGAINVNLWHGTPIKMIGKDTKKMSKKTGEKPVVKNSLFDKVFNRILRPFHYVRPDYFISSSDFTTEKIFKSAFGLEDRQYKSFGYPRSDIFFWEKERIEKFIGDFEPDAIQAFIREIKFFEKVYFYLPTFRDSDRDFIQDAGLDLKKLNDIMRLQNAVFVFKMHPRTQIDLSSINAYPHLKVLEKEADIYTVMPFTDCLISDYSSVYFDYLLLEKEIILFPFDMEDYLRDSRALYFDYQEVIIGKTAYAFGELISFLQDDNSEKDKLYYAEQRRLRGLFWDDYKGNSASLLLDFLRKV